MGKDNTYNVASSLEIEEFLSKHSGWSFDDDRLKVAFKVGDFDTAIAVINEVAEVATKMDHHPRMTNTYNQLEFSLCTHSVGDKVTSYDMELAKAISDIVAKHQ